MRMLILFFIAISIFYSCRQPEPEGDKYISINSFDFAEEGSLENNKALRILYFSGFPANETDFIVEAPYYTHIIAITLEGLDTFNILCRPDACDEITDANSIYYFQKDTTGMIAEVQKSFQIADDIKQAHTSDSIASDATAIIDKMQQNKFVFIHPGYVKDINPGSFKTVCGKLSKRKNSDN